MPASGQDLISRLLGHRTMSAAPRAELEWLISHGSIRTLNTGEALSAKGREVEAFYTVLSGRLAMFLDRGSGPNKFLEWHEGDVAGMLPYSRLVTPPGDVIALEPTEVFAVPRSNLKEMMRECFEVTTILVHIMLDRARLFTSADLQNEKMVSLGKLSAGLAHELNNPASAIERCAAMLEDRLEDSEQATRILAAATLTTAEMNAVEAIRAACIGNQKHKERSPLEQCDREEEILGWLSSHGLDTADAQMLADTEVTFEALEAMLAAVDRSHWSAVVRWAAAGCAVRNLTAKIQASSMRISSLVTAVKGFTHMDQANVAEPVDLRDSLANTLTVLTSKAREKSVSVTLDMESNLPKVRGFAAELSQIWGNLVENALDAVAKDGHVDVHATRENKNVLVRIVDDGPGVSKEHRDSIFDPFFTTKPFGQGTGLGLDIVRRLVKHNDGAVEFESQPGKTEFRVRLPIADADEARPTDR